MLYLIKDEESYLQWFNNNTVWFTADPDQALVFNRQQEAEIVANSLNGLASTELKVIAYVEVL